MFSLDIGLLTRRRRWRPHCNTRPSAAPRLAVRLASTAGVVALVTTGLALPAPPSRPVVESRISALHPGIVRSGFAKTVDLSAPTQLVGFDWRGSAAGTLRVRARHGARWGPWSPVEGNPREGPDRGGREDRGLKDRGLKDRGRTGAGPIWLGAGADAVEVRVVEGTLPGLRMHAIRSEAPRRGIWSPPAAVADPAWPDVISRRDWGADESRRACTADQAPGVRLAIVHHTATGNDYSPGDVPAILRGILEFHVRGNGWCDIGYNFLVDRFGRVWEGRFGGVERAPVGAHAAGFNTGSTGVALLGTFQDAPVPPQTYAGLRRLLAWKLSGSVDPASTVTVTAAAGSRFTPGSEVTLRTISGHRDVDNTDCPGDVSEGLLERLRAEVQTDILRSVPFPAKGWTPSPGAPALLALDGYGGLHPAGGQAAVTHSHHTPGRLTARGAVRDGAGGYVVDGSGALHPFGGAPAVQSTAISPLDSARGVARGPRPHSGWVLDGSGLLHPYGGAPLILAGPGWPGQDVARGVASNRLGTGGYVVDRAGGLHAFGLTPPVRGPSLGSGDEARAVALRPDGISGYVLDAAGGLHPFGGAPARVAPATWPGRDMARGLVLAGDGNAGWVLDADGHILAFGGAAPVATQMTWSGLGLSRALV